MVTRLDAHVGRIMALLDELKLDRDTAVFFASEPLPGAWRHTGTAENAVRKAESKGAAAIFVVIQLPGGTRLSLQPAGAVPGIAPFATGFTPAPLSGTIFIYRFTGAEPPGLYSWFAALTQAGTLNVVGSIDQGSFTFSP